MARSLERRVENLASLRPRIRGKFLFAGDEKQYRPRGHLWALSAR